MPLVDTGDMLRHAYENKYAVGAFDIVSLDPTSVSGANTGVELAPYLDDLAEQLLAGCREAGMNPAGEIERGK